MRKIEALFFLALVFYAPAQAADKAVSVYAVEGTAHLVRGGRVSALKIDDTCERGDLIETDADGRAEIQIYRFAGCRISGACRILRTLESDVQLELTRGLLFGHMDAKSVDHFQVITAEAVAETKATKFVCRIISDVNGNPLRFSFIVGEGGEILVTLKRSGVTVKVPENHSIDIDKGTYTPSIRAHLEEEKSFLRETTSVVIGNYA